MRADCQLAPRRTLPREEDGTHIRARDEQVLPRPDDNVQALDELLTAARQAWRRRNDGRLLKLDILAALHDDAIDVPEIVHRVVAAVTPARKGIGTLVAADVELVQRQEERVHAACVARELRHVLVRGHEPPAGIGEGEQQSPVRDVVLGPVGHLGRLGIAVEVVTWQSGGTLVSA